MLFVFMLQVILFREFVLEFLGFPHLVSLAHSLVVNVSLFAWGSRSSRSLGSLYHVVGLSLASVGLSGQPLRWLLPCMWAPGILAASAPMESLAVCILQGSSFVRTGVVKEQLPCLELRWTLRCNLPSRAALGILLRLGVACLFSPYLFRTRIPFLMFPLVLSPLLFTILPF